MYEYIRNTFCIKLYNIEENIDIVIEYPISRLI